MQSFEEIKANTINFKDLKQTIIEEITSLQDNKEALSKYLEYEKEEESLYKKSYSKTKYSILFLGFIIFLGTCVFNYSFNEQLFLIYLMSFICSLMVSFVIFAVLDAFCFLDKENPVLKKIEQENLKNIHQATKTYLEIKQNESDKNLDLDLIAYLTFKHKGFVFRKHI